MQEAFLYAGISLPPQQPKGELRVSINKKYSLNISAYITQS